jgi:hypothetical protein
VIEDGDIDSKQGARYIQPNWGSELKYNILEHDGIRVVNKDLNQQQEPVANVNMSTSLRVSIANA